MWGKQNDSKSLHASLSQGCMVRYYVGMAQWLPETWMPNHLCKSPCTTPSNNPIVHILFVFPYVRERKLPGKRQQSEEIIDSHTPRTLKQT